MRYDDDDDEVYCDLITSVLSIESGFDRVLYLSQIFLLHMLWFFPVTFCILNICSDRQAQHWEPDGFRRRPGFSRQNWREVINKDLKKRGIRLVEVQEATEDRQELVESYQAG